MGERGIRIMAGEILIPVLALLVGYLTYRLRPDAVRGAYMLISGARALVFGIIGILIALSFIWSGVWSLVLLGSLILVVTAWAVIIRRPDESVAKMTP